MDEVAAVGRRARGRLVTLMASAHCFRTRGDGQRNRRKIAASGAAPAASRLGAGRPTTVKSQSPASKTEQIAPAPVAG